jgi:hypothetical protein
MRQRFIALALALLSSFAAQQVRAHDVRVYQEPPPPPPVYMLEPAPRLREVTLVAPRPVLVQRRGDDSVSVLKYSLQGFFAGALAGLAVAYLATDGAQVHEPWRALVLGSGIGALSGAGLGIGLGVADAASDRRPPAARFVMRDSVYGTLLGAAFGGTVGGLVVLHSHDGRDAVVGTAIGAVSGCVLGALVGVLEGRWRRRDHPISGALQLSRDLGGRHVVGPSLAGRF